MADALSRVDAITFPQSIDYDAFHKQQLDDLELLNLLKNPSSTSLNLKQCAFSKSSTLVYCDVNQTKVRPFVPLNFRRHIFTKFHCLSHSGIKSTSRLITSRFVWPSMNKDIRDWTKACVGCQKAKVNRHTHTEFQKF